MKALLGIVAAYIGVSYFFPNLLSGAISMPNSVANNPQASGNTSPLDIKTLMLQKAQANPLATLTYDQWNYYFHQIRGVYARAFENTGLPSRDVFMTIDEFLQYANVNLSTGLSGISYTAVRTSYPKQLTNTGERLNIERVQ